MEINGIGMTEMLSALYGTSSLYSAQEKETETKGGDPVASLEISRGGKLMQALSEMSEEERGE
ncbi:MAG: hypothetical protein JW821_10650, partial [Deltaproteobacteria bacterium]|nr:hypothetical protein [Deltaproteobacteria bacterium]